MSAEPRSPESKPAPPSERSSEGSGQRPGGIEEAAARVRNELWAPLFAERAKVVVALVTVAVVIGAHLARIGVPSARITAGVLLLVAVVGPAVLELVVRRRARDAHRVLSSASFVLGGPEVARALEHVSLADRIVASPDHEGVSPTLARLHAARALSKLDLRRLRPRGEELGNVARKLSLALVGLALIALAIAPARFVEGLDVALSQKGIAPLPLPWLDEVELTVHPPSYVHKNDAKYHGYGAFVAERGAALVLRGLPRRTGRTLVLADDHHEVPFLDDGAGGVVAHWSVTVSGKLRVRARFGDVAIEEPRGWEMTAIQDETPEVTLEGAPGTIEIAKTDGTVALRYDASDDYGLREVHLVIRIGTREERRVLAKLDGEPKHDRGGYVLRTTDPLIQKARTPIRVRVEARDNDPITGPKWGKSAELTLIPPVLGAAEAKRYEDMLAVRNTLVDLLAKAIAGEKTAAPDRAKDLSREFDAAADVVDQFLGTSHDGLRIPPRVAAAARGRLRKAREAIDAEGKTPNDKAHAASITAIEKLVLGVDGALRSMGFRDARTTAKLVSEVADDAGDAIHELANAPKDREAEPKARVDVDVDAIAGGGASLRKLGELGRDLGEIVENDLKRVARARAAGDMFHAELAMRDLALRLRDPVSSFGGGGNPSAPGDPTDDDDTGEQSEGESEAGNQEKKLEDLAKEHGENVGSVEDLLRDAEDPKQLEGLEEEAKKRAKKLRDSVASLPKVGGLKKTFEASEAATREKVESMAEALEKLQLGDAKERGESSLKAIDEARDRAWVVPGADEKLDSIGTEVQKQLDWIDDLLKKLRKAAADKAAEKVKGKAPREKDIGKKAGDLGESSEKTAPLPGPVKDLLDEAAKKMDEAAGKLEKGEGDKGLELQKEAQRLLEKARDAMKGQDQPSGGEGGNKSFDPDDKVDIPPADKFKGPDAFRKRVLEGLRGNASPKLQEAIKRYAEGLVR